MNTAAFRRLASILLTLTLAMSAVAGAQERGRDRDRAVDRDRTAQQDRYRDLDTDRARDRDRDRDDLPIYLQDRERLRLSDIFGAALMTQQERRQYRERIDAMQNVRDWAAYRAEHQRLMMARARERNVELPEPLYGQQLMTDQERIQLRTRLEHATSSREREQIMDENRERMQARARANNIPLGEL